MQINKAYLQLKALQYNLQAIRPSPGGVRLSRMLRRPVAANLVEAAAGDILAIARPPAGRYRRGAILASPWLLANSYSSGLWFSAGQTGTQDRGRWRKAVLGDIGSGFAASPVDGNGCNGVNEKAEVLRGCTQMVRVGRVSGDG